jgi:hypothetical protein
MVYSSDWAEDVGIGCRVVEEGKVSRPRVPASCITVSECEQLQLTIHTLKGRVLGL